ncbi:MAG: alkaline phosphatase family protein [Lentisphaeria bacterium]|nr:alkaline phosphatase family protein [Lentisphaeria bacterium]
MSHKKLLIVQVAGLGADLANAHVDALAGTGLSFHALRPPFPAVTCTAQATFRTASAPADHGMVCNGFFDRDARRTEFWNQSARLVQGCRVWTRFRERGGTVGVLFWQQILGEEADLVFSPAPVHKHHGGMIQACYALPRELEEELTRNVGAFNLRHYWGPLASAKASLWITAATETLLDQPERCPDVLLTYLPHLDYVLQRHGPTDTKHLPDEMEILGDCLTRLAKAADSAGRELLVWGDYAITPATQVAHPNQVLRRDGLLEVRRIRGMTYPDLYASRAFAMVDHQVAHVFVPNPDDIGKVRQCLETMEGVDRIEPRAAHGHPREGELILTAAPGNWFAYPWWDDPREAPDYARHVDIHSKIGFDPCELFWGWPPMSVSLDTSRVGGTHGRNDALACFATTTKLADTLPENLVELATAVRTWLDNA